VTINLVRTNNNDLLSPSAKVFSAKMSGWVDPPKFSTAKVLCYTVYHIVGEFGESSMICQTKTIQISTYNYNLLDESIHLPNFFSPNA